MVIGMLLLTRPLTALTILIALACASPAIVVLRWAARDPARRRAGWVRASVMLAFGISALLMIWLPAVARISHWLLALGVCALAVMPLWRARRSRDRLAVLRSVFVLGTGVAVAALCVLWPDLALIAAGALAAVLAVVAGAVLAVRTLLRVRQDGSGPDRHRRRGNHRARSVVGMVAMVATCVIGVTATAASIGLQRDTHRIDDFYSYADDVPDEPGQLLRIGEYSGEVPAGAAAVRILYSTTYSDGSPALGSAVVAYPTSAAASDDRLVLAWQHGTTGIAQSCAPSAMGNALTEEGIPGIARAIANGWVTVAADYPGQGTPGRYPYLIGEGEARSTLDAVRAARAISEADASDQVLLWGHSQGGHATLWAGQIAGDYAPELEVRAVAALSAASDPLVEAKAVSSAGVIASVVTPYLLVPYAQEYSDISMTDIVHPAGLAIVDALASRCATDPTMLASALSAFAVSGDAPLFSFDFDAGPVHDRLSQNIADGIVPAPLFLGQGVDDEVIPISMQRALGAVLEEAGRDVVVHEYAGRNHMGVVAADSPLIDDLYDWADAVLAVCWRTERIC